MAAPFPKQGPIVGLDGDSPHPPNPPPPPTPPLPRQSSPRCQILAPGLLKVLRAPVGLLNRLMTLDRAQAR